MPTKRFDCGSTDNLEDLSLEQFQASLRLSLDWLAKRAKRWSTQKAVEIFPAVLLCRLWA